MKKTFLDYAKREGNQYVTNDLHFMLFQAEPKILIDLNKFFGRLKHGDYNLELLITWVPARNRLDSIKSRIEKVLTEKLNWSIVKPFPSKEDKAKYVKDIVKKIVKVTPSLNLTIPEIKNANTAKLAIKVVLEGLRDLDEVFDKVIKYLDADYFNDLLYAWLQNKIDLTKKVGNISRAEIILNRFGEEKAKDMHVGDYLSDIGLKIENGVAVPVLETVEEVNKKFKFRK